MKICAVLLSLCLLTGCATRTWVETTDQVRTTGPTEEVVEDRLLSDEYFEVRTNIEDDKYTVNETVSSDEEGRISIDLLAPSLQCLFYKHDITLELWSYDEPKPIFTRVLTTANSIEYVREWAVQAKLGQQVLLRRKAADRLDLLIDATEDADLRANLETIRVKLKIRLEWE